MNVIRDSGIASAVTVDIESIKCLHLQKMPVSHVGHLVQIPIHEFILDNEESNLSSHMTWWSKWLLGSDMRVYNQ